jgi:hypothetical protein
VVSGVMMRTGWCCIRGTVGYGGCSGDAGGRRTSESLGTGVEGAGGICGDPKTMT